MKGSVRVGYRTHEAAVVCGGPSLRHLPGAFQQSLRREMRNLRPIPNVTKSRVITRTGVPVENSGIVLEPPTVIV